MPLRRQWARATAAARWPHPEPLPGPRRGARLARALARPGGGWQLRVEGRGPPGALGPTHLPDQRRGMGASDGGGRRVWVKPRGAQEAPRRSQPILLRQQSRHFGGGHPASDTGCKPIPTPTLFPQHPQAPSAGDCHLRWTMRDYSIQRWTDGMQNMRARSFPADCQPGIRGVTTTAARRPDRVAAHAVDWVAHTHVTRSHGFGWEWVCAGGGGGVRPSHHSACWVGDGRTRDRRLETGRGDGSVSICRWRLTTHRVACEDGGVWSRLVPTPKGRAVG